MRTINNIQEAEEFDIANGVLAYFRYTGSKKLYLYLNMFTFVIMYEE